MVDNKSKNAELTSVNNENPPVKKAGGNPPKGKVDPVSYFNNVLFGSSQAPKNKGIDQLQSAMHSTDSAIYNTKGNYGKSKYDKNIVVGRDVDFNNIDSSFEDLRAQQQGAAPVIAAGLGRIATRATAEVLKLPGYLAGAGMAAFAEEGKGWETAFNNEWIKSVEKATELANDELLTVYKPESVRNGDIFDNLSSLSFWATEGADGVGTLLSMFVPGAALKGLTLGSKFVNGASKLRYLKNAEKAAELATKYGKAATYVDRGVVAGVNAMAEAASGAGGQMDDFDQNYAPQLTEKLLTEKTAVLERRFRNGEIDVDQYKMAMEQVQFDVREEVNLQKANLGRNVFAGYLASSLVPNFIQSKFIYGLDDAMESITKKSAGGFFTKAGATQQLGKVARATASEGLYEEGVQTTVENYFSDKARQGKLGKNGMIKDFNLAEMGDAYLEMLGTTDGQKAVVLGALLGSGAELTMGNIQDRKHDAQLEQFKTKMEPYRQTAQQIVSEGIYQRNAKGSVIMDDKGKPKVNTVAAKRLVESVIQSKELNARYDKAVAEGNVDEINAITEQALINQAVTFGIHGDSGLALLEQESKEMIDVMKAAGKSTVEAEANAKQLLEYAKVAMFNSQVFDKYSGDLGLAAPSNETEAEFQNNFLSQKKGSYLYEKAFIVSKEQKKSALKEELAEVKKHIETPVVANTVDELFGVSTVSKESTNPTFGVLDLSTGKMSTDKDDNTLAFDSITEAKTQMSMLFDGLSDEQKTMKTPIATKLENQIKNIDNQINDANKRINERYFNSKDLKQQYAEGLASHVEFVKATAEAEQYGDIFSALDAIASEEDLDTYIKELAKEKYEGGKLPDAVQVKVDMIRNRLQLEAQKKATAAANKNTGNTEPVINKVNLIAHLNIGYELDEAYQNELQEIIDDETIPYDEKRALIIQRLLELEKQFKNDPDLKFMKYGDELYSANEIVIELFKELNVKLSNYGEVTNLDKLLSNASKILSPVQMHQFVQKIGQLIINYRNLITDFNVQPSPQQLKFIQTVIEELNDKGYDLGIHDRGVIGENQVIRNEYATSAFSSEHKPEVAKLITPAILYNGLVVLPGVVDSVVGKSDTPNPNYTEGTMSDNFNSHSSEYRKFAQSILARLTEAEAVRKQAENLQRPEGDEINDDVDVETINEEVDQEKIDQLEKAKKDEKTLELGPTPYTKVISTNEVTGELLPMSNQSYLDFERLPMNKIGLSVNFKVDTEFLNVTVVSDNHPGKEAIRLLQSVDWDYTQLDDANKLFVLDNLPLHAMIEGTYSSIEAAPRDQLSEAYQIYLKNARVLRMNILHAMSLEKSNNPVNLKSTVRMQLSGALNLQKTFEIAPGVMTYPENSAVSLINPGNIPLDQIELADLNLLVGRKDGLYELTSSPIDGTAVTPGVGVSGNFYVPITKPNGERFNLKLNTSINSQERSEAIYAIFKSIMTKGVDPSSTTLKLTSIEDMLLEMSPEESNLVRREFAAEIEYINKNAREEKYKNTNNLLAMVVYMDSNNPMTRVTLNNDGSLVLGEKIGSMFPNIGKSFFTGADMENDLYKNEIVQYFKFKRRNVIIPGFVSYGFNARLNAEIGASMSTPDYITYLLSTGALNTNATIENGSPFTGKTNIYVDSYLTNDDNTSQSTINTLDEFLNGSKPPVVTAPVQNEPSVLPPVPEAQPIPAGVVNGGGTFEQGGTFDSDAIDDVMNSITSHTTLGPMIQALTKVSEPYKTMLTGFRKENAYKNALASKDVNVFREVIANKFEELKSLQNNVVSTPKACGNN